MRTLIGTLSPIVLLITLSSSAFADRIYFKQGYTLDVRWEEDPATGLLWYWRGPLRQAVTRADVLRIEPSATGKRPAGPFAPGVTAPPTPPVSDALEVTVADFKVLEQSPYTWRVGYRITIQNHLARPVKVHLMVVFEDLGRSILLHGKELDTTLSPGTQRVFPATAA
jgi:hypothetical protein